MGKIVSQLNRSFKEDSSEPEPSVSVSPRRAVIHHQDVGMAIGSKAGQAFDSKARQRDQSHFGREVGDKGARDKDRDRDRDRDRERDRQRDNRDRDRDAK
jgi:hypothetical protein